MDEQRLERELRAGLVDLLDPLIGSHPMWVTSPAAERATAAPARSWRSLRTGLLWAALLSLLLVVLLASVLFIGGQPTDDAGPSAWTTVEFPEGGVVFDIIETPSGYLAVGWGPHTELGSDGVVWASADCLHWERLPTPVQSAGGDRRGRPDALTDPGPTEIEHAGGVYLAAGGDIGPEAAMWVSPDGRDWERVLPEIASGERTGGLLEPMADIAAVDESFVAVGGWDDDFGRGKPSFWISPDGRSWREVTRVDPPPSGLVGSGWGYFTIATASALTETEAALFAAGTSGPGETVWRSADGQRWAQVLGDEQATGAVLADIAAAPDGTLVAVGQRNTDGTPGDPVLWWSSDGSTWSLLSDMEPFAAHEGPAEYAGVTWLDPEVSLDVITWAGGRFFVLGSEGGPGAAIPVVWTSPDGQTWFRETPGPAFEEASATGAITCGDQVLLYGGDLDTAVGWARPVDSFTAATARGE